VIIISPQNLVFFAIRILRHEINNQMELNHGT
jgi:hypothetical protein